MKKKLLLIIFVALMPILFFQCEDESTGSGIYEEKTIQGTVYYQDTLLETPEKKAPEADIYLHADTIKNPYLYAIKADAEGKFELPYVLQKNTNYQIRGELKADNIVYKGAIFKTKDTGLKLLLTQETPATTLKIKLKLSDQPFYNAKVYLFTNKELLAVHKDTSFNNVTGYTLQDSSNSRGVVLFKSLNNDEGNKYYIFTKYNIGKNKYLDSTSISLSNTQGNFKVIELTKSVNL
ncbi:hypothetical protein [Emticicia soli]|uniref:Carboxypeptidase regulatory-like domain-containing protein n=1 Tax=Emticicia soli TaxID=2027878 RepID=A0ABW5JBB2_9BACT